MFLMHMSDGLISLPIGIIFFIISLCCMGFSISQMRTSDDQKIPMMAVMGAFIFVAQMINFTIPGTGSSGHIGGGILLCLVLGQYPAFLSMCCVLIIQCLFFGDGGLLALGCNMFNMGLIPCLIVYPLIIKPLFKKNINHKTITLMSLLGVVVGLEIGAFCVVIQTLMSQISELPFLSFLVLMLPIHFVIGIVEGIVTGAVVNYVYKENPQMLDCDLYDQPVKDLKMKKILKVFLILSILIGGGLSLCASSLPDGLEWSIEGITGQNEIEATGEAQSLLSQVQQATSILPDYHFINDESHLGTSTSGIIGGALCLFMIGSIGYIASRKRKHG